MKTLDATGIQCVVREKPDFQVEEWAATAPCHVLERRAPVNFHRRTAAQTPDRRSLRLFLQRREPLPLYRPDRADDNNNVQL